VELKDCYDSENLFGFNRNIPLPLRRHVSGRAPVLAVGIPPDQTSENSFTTMFVNKGNGSSLTLGASFAPRLGG
jgi:hypothetical protein